MLLDQRHLQCVPTDQKQATADAIVLVKPLSLVQWEGIGPVAYTVAVCTSVTVHEQPGVVRHASGGHIALM